MTTFKNFSIGNKKFHFISESESKITLEHENAEYRYILPSHLPLQIWATNDSFHWRTSVKAFHVFKAELIDQADRAEYMAEKNRRKWRSIRLGRLINRLPEYHEVTIPSIVGSDGLTYLDVRCLVVECEIHRGVTHLHIVPFDFSGVAGTPASLI